MWVFWLIIPVVLGARLLWQRMPGLPTCALFWGAAISLVALGWENAPSNFVLVSGLTCNALVTLVNGGFMPVSEASRQRGPARSLWVQRHTGQHLLFLADNFGNSHIRFSVGDVLIAAGIVLSVAGL
jgi:hypothetical protein